MKHICLVNLVELNPPANGGTSRIAAEVGRLLAAWGRAEQSFRVVFVVGWRFAAHFPEWLGEDVFTMPYFTPLDTAYWLDAAKPNLIVSPLFGMVPFGSRPSGSPPHIAGMPDALHLDKPELLSQRQRWKRLRVYRQLTKADAVVTLSNHARERLQHHLHIPGERLHVIPLGADALPQGDTEVLNLPERFVFYPANMWSHKRHRLLLQVMNQVWQRQPDVHLILSGGRSAHSTAEIQRLMQELQCPQDRVRDLGYVSDEQLRQLYERAEAMIFTSAYEGFGMPLIEAMYHGCPVICARLTSIPEIAGDAALYVASDDPEAWADAFLNQLPVRKPMLVERGYQRAAEFTWEQTRRKWQMLLEAFVARGTAASPVLDSPYDWGMQSRLLRDLRAFAQPVGVNASRVEEMPYLLLHARRMLSIRRQFAQLLCGYLMG